MACCSRKACNCYLAQGDNITITGDGSADSPYTISTTGAESFTEIVSTSNDCVTIGGLGTIASPLTVTLVFDPDSPIPIECGENGIRVLTDTCQEIMCDDTGVPQGYRTDTETGNEYWDLEGNSLGTTLPTGWEDCGGCTPE
jgi:hypothetical protein